MIKSSYAKKSFINQWTNAIKQLKPECKD